MNNMFCKKKITLYGRSDRPEYSGIAFPVELTMLEAFAGGIGQLLLFEKNIDVVRIGFNNLLFGDKPFKISDSEFSDVIVSILNEDLINLENKKITLTPYGRQVLFDNFNIDRSAYKTSVLRILKVLGATDYGG